MDQTTVIRLEEVICGVSLDTDQSLKEFLVVSLELTVLDEGYRKLFLLFDPKILNIYYWNVKYNCIYKIFYVLFQFYFKNIMVANNYKICKINFKYIF